MRWPTSCTSSPGLAGARLFSGEVDQVDAPGSEGDFGVLAGHAPLTALIGPAVTVYADGERTRLDVHGGFADVRPAA